MGDNEVGRNVVMRDVALPFQPNKAITIPKYNSFTATFKHPSIIICFQIPFFIRPQVKPKFDEPLNESTNKFTAMALYGRSQPVTTMRLF